MTTNNASEVFLHQIRRCIRTGGRITKGLSNACTPQTVNAVMTESGHGESALGYAIRYKFWDIAEFLVRRGANVNFRPVLAHSPMWTLIRTRSNHNCDWERTILLTDILEEISADDLRYFLNQDLFGIIPPLFTVRNATILGGLFHHDYVLEYALLYENLTTGNNVLMDYIFFKNRFAHMRSNRHREHEGMFNMIADEMYESNSRKALKFVFYHRNNDGKNLLRVAMQEQDLSIVSLLLNSWYSEKLVPEYRKIMINHWVDNVDSHLISACKLPSDDEFAEEIDHLVAICKKMTRFGALVNEKDLNGLTPLCHVVKWPDRFFQESYELSAFLLANGADVNETCNNGESILYHASHNFDLTMLLLHHGAAWDDLRSATHFNAFVRAASHRPDLNVTYFYLRDNLEGNLPVFPRED